MSAGHGVNDSGLETSRVESEHRSLQKISDCVALQAGTPDPPHKNAAHFREDPRIGFDTSRVESEHRSLQKLSDCVALQAGTPAILIPGALGKPEPLWWLIFHR